MLLVLALSVALVGPYFVDWTSYRADFEREASRVMGRDVTVRGAASARLLPFPSVTFHDVEVAGSRPGRPAMTIETFSMDAELAPFLRGEVLIFDMRLERPHAVVAVDGQGRLNWSLQPHLSPAVRRVSLESMTVTDGSIELLHASSGRSHLIDRLDAQLSARSLAGPWRMQGSLRFDGVPTGLSATTGQIGETGGTRLRLRAQPADYPVLLETDGRIGPEEGDALYAGDFRLNAASRPVAEADAARDAVADDYRLNGRFSLDHVLLAVEEYRFETGPHDDPYVAEGTAALELGEEPRFVVRGDGAQVRLGDEEAAAGALRLGERLAGLRDFILGLPRPTIPGRIEVRLPAVIAGDTTIRDVELTAEPADGGWRLETLNAQLPGRTRLEVSGDLMTAGEFDFTGSLLLAVAQPSGFAAWLARDVDEAIRRLPAAGFSADVELSDGRQIFRDLELILGTARFQGEIDHRQPQDARPAMALRLEGERLDLEGMNAFASIFVGSEGANRFADHDLSFDLKAGPVAAYGLEAASVDTALRLGQNRLEIDRLAIGGLHGTNLSATGTIADLDATPTGNIDATLLAADLEPLVEVLADRFPDNWLISRLDERVQAYPDLMSDARFDIVASGGGEGEPLGASFDISGEAGGTRYAATGSLEDAAAGWRESAISLAVSADNDEAGAVLAMLGLPALPIDLAGPAAVELTLSGVPADAADAHFELTGEGLTAAFDGRLNVADAGPAIQGQASLRSSDLAPWLMVSGVALPDGAALNGIPVTLEGQIDYENGLVVAEGLAGAIADIEVAGDINGELRDGRPHLSGAVSARSFDLALLAEMLVGADALDAGSDGIWPDEPFRRTADMPLTASVSLDSQMLHAGPVRFEDARLDLRVEANAIEVADLQARLHDGRASGLFEWRNEAGTGLFSGQLRLQDADLAAFLGDDHVTGRLDLSASLTSNGMSVETMVAALAGSGNATIRDLVIDGINPEGLDAIMAQAENLGTEIDAATTAQLAHPIVTDGAFGADRLDLALSVAGGRVRAPPFRLERETARLAGEMSVDLRRLATQTSLRLTYDPGQEALPGAEPSVAILLQGPIGDPSVELDSTMLGQFLTQRALEREQARVEAMQALLLEQQRHRREARYYTAREQARAEAAVMRLRSREDEIRRFEEQARLLAEQREVREAEREAEAARLEEERLRAEAEARAQAEEEAMRQAEDDARRAEEERLREENERLREEVETLLRARELGLPGADDVDDAFDGSAIERAPLPAPQSQAAPREVAPEPGAAAVPDTPSPGGGLFAPETLTIDGLLQGEGEDGFYAAP